MAKPDTDDGWFKMAHELDAALDLADFSKAERVILNTIKAQLFGPAQAPHALVIVRNLAEQGDWIRQFIEKGVSRLLHANVIAPVEGQKDVYRFNKYYKTWAFNGGFLLLDGNRTRFTDGELRYIAEAPDRARSFKQVLSTRPGAKPHPRRCKNGTPTGAKMHPDGCETAPAQVPKCTPTGAFSSPPLEPPIRNGELRMENDIYIAGERGAGPGPTEDAPLDTPRAVAIFALGLYGLDRGAEGGARFEAAASEWFARGYTPDQIRRALLDVIVEREVTIEGAAGYASMVLKKYARLARREAAQAAKWTAPARPAGPRGGIAAEIDAKHRRIQEGLRASMKPAESSK